jgi:predicted PurR-regulated permease PerM
VAIFSRSELAGTQLSELARSHGLAAAGIVAAWVGAFVSRLGYVITAIILVPVYAFFFMLHFNTIVKAVHDHIPQAYRPTVVRVVTTIDNSVSSFFRGRLLVAALVGLLNGVGWFIVGVPYSLALGAAAGILQLVPFMGVIVLPFALILAYAEAPPGAWLMPVVLAFSVYMIVQAIESFVIAPYVDARSSGLHPVTTIVVLMIGAELSGLLGMLISIPLASTIKSLGMEYVMPEVRRLAGFSRLQTPAAPYTFATEPPPPAGPGAPQER